MHLLLHYLASCLPFQFYGAGREPGLDGSDPQDLQEAQEAGRRWLEQIASAGLLLHFQSLLSPNLVSSFRTREIHFNRPRITGTVCTHAHVKTSPPAWSMFRCNFQESERETNARNVPRRQERLPTVTVYGCGLKRSYCASCTVLK